MILNKTAFVFATLVIASYQTLTESCEVFKFVKQEGLALVDHVIKTVFRGVVEMCWSECVWLPNCFSINVRLVYDVLFECELNNSTNEGSPGNLVPRQGTEYHDMADVEEYNCSLYECKIKQVLPDGWFRLDMSVFKLFNQKKNWTDARQHCKSLGAELVSISNSYKDDFVFEALVKDLIKTVNSNKSSGSAQPTDAYWALDGHDKDVILYGTSTYENTESETALRIDQSDSSNVPAVPFNPEGFTIAFWVKILPVAKTKDNTLYSDLPSYENRTFRINWNQDRKEISLELYTPSQSKFLKIKTLDSSIPRNRWEHIAITWNKTEVKGQVVLDGNLVKTKVTPDPFVFSSTIKTSLRSYYGLGSGKENAAIDKYKFNGNFRHLMVFNRTLSVKEIQEIMKWTEYGPWIGLSDERDDKMFAWSDGSSVGQYVPLPIYIPNTASVVTSCVAMGNNGKWTNKKCSEKRPFICQKPM